MLTYLLEKHETNKSAPTCCFTILMSAKVVATLGLEPGARDTIQIYAEDNRNPIGTITIASQSLHYQKAEVRRQSWELNSDILM